MNEGKKPRACEVVQFSQAEEPRGPVEALLTRAYQHGSLDQGDEQPLIGDVTGRCAMIGQTQSHLSQSQ